MNEDAFLVLIRRAGAVEEPPPPSVWQEITTTLRRERARERAVGGRRWWPLLAAAAVGSLLTWTGLEVSGRPDERVVVAGGLLASLSATAPAGAAEVVEVNGHRLLRVELEEVPDPGDGYLEVWLLRPDVSGMVTLGVLDGGSGEFLVPPGVDLQEFPVVDISIEHVDGDPAHGGDSLVRGELG